MLDACYLERVSDFVKKEGFRYGRPKTSEEVNSVGIRQFEWSEYVAKQLCLLD